MAVKFTNNAATTLAAGINSSVTSIAVTDGSVFPTITGSDHFYVTFDDTTNKEIVKVTARSGNTLTVVRGHDNTTARAFSSGDKAELRIVAALLEDVKTDVSSTLTVDTFTGDDSTTAFTLSTAPASEDNLIVFIEGVYQNPGDFTLSGTTLTLDVAPLAGRKIVAYHVSDLVAGNNLTHNQFTCNGSTTAFTLSLSPIHENNTQVFLDGVYQQKTDYTVSGTTLTMDTAPANGAILEVMTFTQTDVNTLPASFVSGLTQVTAVGADHFMIFDATDSQLKKSLVSDVLESATSISTSADATAITIDSSENVTFTAAVTTGTDLSIGGSNNELRFYEGSNYVGFEAPALTGDQIWVLPAADGSNGQVISTDGSGNLSFSTVSGGPTHKEGGTNFTNSIMIGDSTTGTLNAATGNTGLGVDVFAALTEGDNNVAIGKGTMGANTTGVNNTAVGQAALDANTTGINNVAVGWESLGANTDTSYNTAIGWRCLEDNTASDNTAVGAGALQNNTTAVGNTAVGKNALQETTTATQVTALGYRAGEDSTGSSSTFIGYLAGTYTTTGGQNTFIGASVAESGICTGTQNTLVGGNNATGITSGADNTVMGTHAARNLTTGAGHVAIGTHARRLAAAGNNGVYVGIYSGYNHTAGRSVMVGEYAGYDSTSTDDSVFLGRLAGENVTTGYTEVIIGDRAGQSITTGYNHTCIGYKAGDNITTGYASIIIGTNDAAEANSRNEIVIGAGLAGKGYHQAFIGGVNGIYNQPNSSSWSTTSDRRIKKNIHDYTLGLDVLEQIQVRNFEYRELEEMELGTDGQPLEKSELPKGNQVGVIAQEIQDILPSVVKENETNGRLSVDNDEVTWLLVKAVQELSAQVKELQEKLDD